MNIPKSFLGYKRENGRAGTRNHVIILPVALVYPSAIKPPLVS